MSHYRRYTENCCWQPGLLSHASQYQGLVSCRVLLLKQLKKWLIGLKTDSLIAQWGLTSKPGEELTLDYARLVGVCMCTWDNYIKSRQALLLTGMCKRWQRSAVPMRIYRILKYIVQLQEASYSADPQHPRSVAEAALFGPRQGQLPLMPRA